MSNNDFTKEQLDLLPVAISILLKQKFPKDWLKHFAKDAPKELSNQLNRVGFKMHVDGC